MRIFSRVSLISVLVSTFFFTSPAGAVFVNVTNDTVLEGTIFENGGNVTADYYIFDIDGPSQFTANVLSRDVLPGSAADGLSNLNSTLLLFEFSATGSLGLLGDLILQQDDSNDAEASADGSVDFRDSYLDVVLNTGRYILAISDFFFSENDARAGGDTSSSTFGGGFADYRLALSGIADPTPPPPPAPVPLPGAAIFMIAGLGALTAGRKMRVSQ